MTKTFYDISVTLSSDVPVWEGDPKLEITPLASMAGGDIANVSHVKMGVHIGTHIDAPIHFVAGRTGIDLIPLSVLMGKCWVCDLSHVQNAITGVDLEGEHIPEDVQRLLIKTTNSNLWNTKGANFERGFIALASSAAAWITKRGIKLVGIDYLGIEPFDSVANGAPTHKILLSAETVVVEGLNLSGIAVGEYELICLPIKIKNSDGAPARAVLIEEK